MTRQPRHRIRKKHESSIGGIELNKGKWLSVEDPRWLTTLDEVAHSIYQRPEYVRMESHLNNSRPVAYLFEEAGRVLLLPLELRSMPTATAPSSGDWCIALSESGPCVSGFRAPIEDQNHERSAFMAKAIGAFSRDMNEARIAACHLRSHSLSNGHLELRQYGETISDGTIVYCDLSLSDEELWRQTRRRDRSYINRTRRNGFRVIRDHRWRRLDEFASTYCATFPDNRSLKPLPEVRRYLSQFRDDLDGRASLFLVVDSRNRLAGGGVFTECGGNVEYHLGGVSNHFRNEQPSKLMLHNVRLWAKARGHRYFQLGGGSGAEIDTLLHFKRSFSKSTATISNGCIVANSTAYQRWISSIGDQDVLAPVPQPIGYRNVWQTGFSANSPRFGGSTTDMAPQIKLHIPAAA